MILLLVDTIMLRRNEAAYLMSHSLPLLHMFRSVSTSETFLFSFFGKPVCLEVIFNAIHFTLLMCESLFAIWRVIYK